MPATVLFGCGTGLELYLSMLDSSGISHIECIVDNNPKVSEICGIPVKNASYLAQLTDKKIIITSRHYIDIFNQIVANGVAKEDIEVFNALINW